jgi:nitrate/TMAO reductase-like tetraheme cytochrome c subunit
VSVVDAAGKGTPPKRPHRRLRLGGTLAVIGFLTVVFLAIFIPLQLTSTNSFCASCHAMDEAKSGWQHSRHANVSCVKCHIPPGFSNAFKWRSHEWLNIWASWLNVKQTAMKQSLPTNAACRSCHDLSRIPVQQGDIRMPHELHVNLRGLNCIDCHDKISHAAAGQSATVSMTVCTMCHSRTGPAPSQCAFCHITPPPKNVHPPDYIKTHGLRALENQAECLRCHHDKVAFCDACHANPTPAHFSTTWRYTHGKAATADRLGCLGCHNEQTFCMQCHRVSHPADWVQAHGPVAAQSGGSCLVCHPSTMCVTCHNQQSPPIVAGVKP